MNFNLSIISGKILDLINRFYKYFVIVFVLIVLVSGYVLVVKPKWDEINQTGVFDYNYETKSLEETKDYLDRLKASIEKFEKLNRSDIEKLSQIIPSDKDIQGLFVIFEELAAKNMMKMQSIDITTGEQVGDAATTAAAPVITETGVTETEAQEVAQKSPTAKNIGTLDIALILAGTGQYQEIKNLLVDFEKELRIMDIISLDFTTPDATSVESVADYSLQIRTYYYDEGGK